MRWLEAFSWLISLGRAALLGSKGNDTSRSWYWKMECRGCDRHLKILRRFPRSKYSCTGQDSEWETKLRPQSGPFAALCTTHFFNFFLPSYWVTNSYYPRGLANIGKGKFKTWWDRELSVPGPFFLDLLQPFAPLTFWNIPNFFKCLMGGQLENC